MPLEAATFISDLVATNPTGADLKNAGDDHLRLVKSALKATLPNITGAVTATHLELNHVAGVTGPLQPQIGLKANSAGPTFTGTVGLPATTSIGPVSALELGYLDGVTGPIQAQINAGGSTLVATQTAANSAAIDFAGLDPNLDYDILAEDVVASSSGAQIGLQVSQTNGAPFIAAGYDVMVLIGAGTSSTATGNNMGLVTGPVSTANPARGAAFTVRLRAIGSTKFKNIHAQGVYPPREGVDPSVVFSSSMVYTGTPAAYNAVRLLPHIGSFASGTFRLHKIARA